MDLGTGFAIGVAVVGAIVWAIRVEGVVKNHDTKHEQHVMRDEQIRLEALERDTEIRETATHRYGELREEMRYMRSRFDGSTGKWPRET